MQRSNEKKIYERLRELKKEIVVVIDDLDRLTKEEIFETSKIIRVTLDAAEITFILAYDKDSVGKLLGDDLYLDKMVSAEIQLPKIAKKYTDPTISPDGVLNVATVIFPPVTNQQEHTIIYPMIGLGGGRPTPAFKDIFLDNISTIRDLKRLLNSYRLTLEALMSTVVTLTEAEKIAFHECLFKVEILKLKYSDIYHRLCKKDSTLINPQSNYVTYAQEEKIFCPGLDESNPNHSKIRELICSIFLVNHPENRIDYNAFYERHDTDFHKNVLGNRSSSRFWSVVFEKQF